MINLGGIIDASTLDYPGKVAMVIFFRGCPLRCIYCHNHRLLNGEDLVEEHTLEQKIQDASPFISAIVFSGGEPFMQSEPLLRLASFAKNSGLLLGIETSGYYPDRINEFGKKGLIDTLFLDIKAPLSNTRLYELITGRKDVVRRVKASLDHALHADFDLEIRTTVFRGLVGSEEVEAIARFLSGFRGTYVIQEGVPDLAPEYGKGKLSGFSYDEIREMGATASRYVDHVFIRTKEKGLEVV
ncbi:MAG: anaerobic ribonucleoside-triphosphate reductase activating protein [Candidatus Syntrophoarchaeum sp. WYZ-LMO15]|nr:MAG: anaerobic ribonucleoside-triphosphate reductase activating protein [Candidatus Syntrophoarchaeum sp. WYZ-LMO15]